MLCVADSKHTFCFMFESYSVAEIYGLGPDKLPSIVYIEIEILHGVWNLHLIIPSQSVWVVDSDVAGGGGGSGFMVYWIAVSESSSCSILVNGLGFASSTPTTKRYFYISVHDWIYNLRF